MTDIPQALYEAWGGRRYRSLGLYLQQHFGQRVGKISIEAGLSCPNRDGTTGKNGCTFCRPDTFSGNKLHRNEAILQQTEAAAVFLKRQYGYSAYIAYFQTYTNTYAPVDTLRSMYLEALKGPGVAGLAIATRPDCLGDDVLDLLESLGKQTYLWVELGLQSACDETLKRINRGHDAACFADACRRLHSRGIPVCAHIIAGLPGEDSGAALRTVSLLNELQVEGLKLHQLQIVKDTVMEHEYHAGSIQCLELDAYLKWTGEVLATLNPDTVIHRLFSISAPDSIIAPVWGKTRQQIQRALEQYLEENHIWQGKDY